MEDEDFNEIAAKLALTVLLAGVACIGSCIREKNKENHAVYKGVIDGQKVRYMEFADRNVMEIQGKNGTYTLTDLTGFHRLSDPAFTNDILEKIILVNERSPIVYTLNNTNMVGFERDIADYTFHRLNAYYNNIRQEAVKSQVLKLENEE